MVWAPSIGMFTLLYFFPNGSVAVPARPIVAAISSPETVFTSSLGRAAFFTGIKLPVLYSNCVATFGWDGSTDVSKLAQAVKLSKAVKLNINLVIFQFWRKGWHHFPMLATADSHWKKANWQSRFGNGFSIYKTSITAHRLILQCKPDRLSVRSGQCRPSKKYCQ